MLIGLRLWRNAAESGEAIRANLSDPYSIAFLRGGKNEMLRIATISLIDRRILKVAGSNVSTVAINAANGVRSPLEQQVLVYFAAPKTAPSIFSTRTFDAIAGQYERDLAQIGALPDASIKSARMGRLALALLLLWSIAFVKIAVAMARGRSNIQFLIILAVVFAVLAYKAANPRTTG